MKGEVELRPSTAEVLDTSTMLEVSDSPSSQYLEGARLYAVTATSVPTQSPTKDTIHALIIFKDSACVYS